MSFDREQACRREIELSFNVRTAYIDTLFFSYLAWLTGASVPPSPPGWFALLTLSRSFFFFFFDCIFTLFLSVYLLYI